MKVTRATVEEYATQRGMEPFQIDGVPDGFSWMRRADTSIGDRKIPGYLMVFIGNREWTNERAFAKTELIASNEEEAKQHGLDLNVYYRSKARIMSDIYQSEIKKRDGTK